MVKYFIKNNKQLNQHTIGIQKTLTQNNTSTIPRHKP